VSRADALSPREFASGVRRVAGRELAAYFDSPIAYVIAIAFTVLANLVFMNQFFLRGTVDMTFYFEFMPYLLAFFLPAITMRLWAEERKQRTIETLLTLPLRPSQAVLGKYLAAHGLYLVFLLGSAPIPVMLFALGDPDPGLIVGGYLGLVAFGALFLAFGAFLSAITADQIVSFVLSTVLGFGFVLTGWDAFVSWADGWTGDWALGTVIYESISVMYPYEAFVRGAVDLASLLYFGLLAWLFLWANAIALERFRR